MAELSSGVENVAFATNLLLSHSRRTGPRQSLYNGLNMGISKFLAKNMAQSQPPGLPHFDRALLMSLYEIVHH